ncbi:MAG TPA: hypothetical protein VMF07_21625 [Solirubrobacteraceae bacterium]|nr:hypothetical protein [Solirubrobacteraceae bacterium]
MSHTRRFTGRWRRHRRLLAAGALVQVTAVAAIAAPTAQADTSELAASTPAGLIQSTGNLYWTANSRGFVLGGSKRANVQLPLDYIGTVYRAAKTNSPGQETVLYQEHSLASLNFGAIKWALVGGQYYGYFVANYPAQGVSKIKRVSLAGGPAVTLGKSPAQIGNRELATDGTNLYWADAKGIREMGINGGTITTLAKGTTFQNVSLDNSYVYYTSLVTGPDGVSEGNLDRVAKTGGKPALVVATPDAGIEALDTLALPVFTEYYLGLTNGTVEEGTTLGGISDVLQPESVGTEITSISRDATNGDILWGQDDFLDGLDLAVDFHDGTTGAVATDAPPLFVQGDGAAMYWGDQHLEKTTL